MNRRIPTAAAAFALLAAGASPPAGAEPATGTLTQSGRTATIGHAWLVAGPDLIDRKTIIRRVVLSSDDLGAKLAACAKMSCTDAVVDSGMTIDLVAGPRMNFWVALNGQKVQYSGTEPYASFSARANDAKRVAGRLVIDKSSASGPKIDVVFDAPLLKSFTAP